MARRHGLAADLNGVVRAGVLGSTVVNYVAKISEPAVSIPTGWGAASKRIAAHWENFALREMPARTRAVFFAAAMSTR